MLMKIYPVRLSSLKLFICSNIKTLYVLSKKSLFIMCSTFSRLINRFEIILCDFLWYFIASGDIHILFVF